MKRFNINNWVKVKLTEEGLDLLEQSHYDLYESIGKPPREWVKPVVDENGYSKFQMWDLMNKFGKYTTLGSKLHIVDVRLL